MCKQNLRNGFTLPEVLITTVIIAGITGLVLVLLGVPEKMSNTNDVKRKYNIKQISNALEQHYFNEQSYNVKITETPTPICKLGVTEDIDPDCISLDYLVQDYLNCLPYESVEPDPNRTGYAVGRDGVQQFVEALYLGHAGGGDVYCQSEPGPFTGDGIINGDEECDDGNRSNNDGCDENGNVEFAYECSGEPSECTYIGAPPHISTIAAGTDLRELSVAIGTDGYPILVGTDYTSKDIIIVKCNDALCSGNDESITTIDVYASDISLAIGSDGYPVMSYLDEFNGDLHVLWCNDHACTGGDETDTTVAATNLPGVNNSITIGTDGFPVISHAEFAYRAVQVTKCNDVACSGGGETTTTIDDDNFKNFGFYNTHVRLSGGMPVIAYEQSGIYGKDIKIAHCNDVDCIGNDETITGIFNSSLSQAPDIQFYPDSSGNAFILHYYNGNLRAMKCSDSTCTSAPPETILATSGIQQFTNAFTVIMTDDNNPVVLYIRTLGGQKQVNFMKCNDAACSGTDESNTVLGDYYSANWITGTVANNGYPLFAYVTKNGSNSDTIISVVSCFNAECTNPAP